jgi:hypothetical protein
MKPLTYLLIILPILPTLLIACSSPAQPTTPQNTTTPFKPALLVALTPSLPAPRIAVAVFRCTPTKGDELSPSYKPDAPVRSVVGHGHILTGIVRSSVDCTPIPDVKLELWSEESDVGHPDEYRATVLTDRTGIYHFECNPTDHIHMRISVQGYRTIASNAYHTQGQPEGTFDIVLEPDNP